MKFQNRQQRLEAANLYLLTQQYDDIPDYEPEPPPEAEAYDERLAIPDDGYLIQDLTPSLIDSVHQQWAELLPPVEHIINRCVTPEMTLATREPHLMMDELEDISTHSLRLSDVIRAIKPPDYTPRGKLVRIFRDDLLTMLQVLCEFTDEIRDMIIRFPFDPWAKCEEFRYTWEANLLEMNQTDRTEENAHLRDVLATVPEGEFEDYKFLLLLYLEIYGLLRQYFYDFRLLNTCEMYSGERPPPESPGASSDAGNGDNYDMTQ